MPPEITEIECVEFEYQVKDVGFVDREYGGSTEYVPGSVLDRNVFAIKVKTDVGITGEYISSNSPSNAILSEVRMCASDLIKKNPLNRERHWSEIRRGLRKYSQMGLSPIDIALWDFAGKYFDAPIHEILGTYRRELPAYPSTFHGDSEGGLDSPEAYADFAEDCLEKGFDAYKMHGFSNTNDNDFIDNEVDLVHTVGERVGKDMDLMLDPSCKYETFSDAVKVGKACDEQDYMWYEDPYRDGGRSQFGHKKLRQLIDTPLLQAEMVRGVEPHADFIVSEGTDFVRADPEYDGGITGAMKIAKIAEGLGLDVEYHAPCPARRHCMAATRNSNYYELALVHPDCDNPRDVPAFESSYSEGLDAATDGKVPVPDDPGLGVSIDWDYIYDNMINKYNFN